MSRVERPMKPDYFPVFAANLVMDEEYEGLTRSEWGSVFLLMMHQWIKEGTLPEAPQKLASLAKCSRKELDSLMARWPKLKPVEDQPGRVAIPWLLAEYKRAMSSWQDFREKQVERGRKSAEARAAAKAAVVQLRDNHGSTEYEHGPNHGSAELEPSINHGSTMVAKTKRSGSTTVQPKSNLHPYPSVPISTESAKALSCAEPEPPAPAQQDPALLSLPCVGNGPREWPVTAATIARWREAFPTLDLLQEARKMRLWLQENPAKCKTFKGMGRFALGWLERTQNGARGSSRPPAPPAQRRTHTADEAFLNQLDGLEIPECDRVQR
jgi:hypothetical protein